MGKYIIVAIILFILSFILPYVFIGLFNSIREKFEKEDNYSIAMKILDKYKEKFNNPLFNEEIAFRIKRIIKVQMLGIIMLLQIMITFITK